MQKTKHQKEINSLQNENSLKKKSARKNRELVEKPANSHNLGGINSDI